MAELIFQEVWWESKSISICYIIMFSILWNQINVTDIVNKSSVSFFVIINTVATKNSALVVVQESFTLHAKKSTYNCSTWIKVIRTNTENSVEVRRFVTSLIHSFSFVYSNSK